MKRRRKWTPPEVDRRAFVLGAATAFGAAGLTQSLPGARPAEGAPPASAGRAGAKPRTEFAVHQDAPAIASVDVGQAGRTVGDSFYFSAGLRSAPGGPQVGQVFGVKSVVKPAAPEEPNVEQRITFLFFTFNDRQDQIVVAGVPDYPVDGAEFDADRPVVRAIVGGTGAFIGARGQLTSTRHPEGGYTQVFSLLK